jgi:hypothetical protein
MKNPWLGVALVAFTCATVFANGGAWQTGVPKTGNISASNKNQHTDVTIKNEAVKIDLHREYAEVDVHYRMHNTGSKVQQDFFFPVERWAPLVEDPESGAETKPSDIDNYRISVDGEELTATDVPGANGKPSEKASNELWGDIISTIKSWKKSVIPFDQNQTREVAIHYQARYAENDESVSDDGHISDATFGYSLSPAATWKGAIGKGKIEINVLHPEPDDVSIEKPKKRFRKVSDTHYEWSFENLKPKLADDIRIIAHSKYDSYPSGYSEVTEQRPASYTLRGHKYFLDHFDYDATASSTLAPQGEHHYDVQNIKEWGRSVEGSPWIEGADGDGIGENITLNIKRPMPLYGILIRPGYEDYESKDTWKKYNRVAALEITLNDEQTFTENIPDETFQDPYLIRVRDYTKPVSKIKMVIKGVHQGTETRHTCISLVQLRAPLTKKPQIQHAR